MTTMTKHCDLGIGHWGVVCWLLLQLHGRTCLALGRKSLESLLGPGGSVLRRGAIKALLMDNAPRQVGRVGSWLHRWDMLEICG